MKHTYDSVAVECQPSAQYSTQQPMHTPERFPSRIIGISAILGVISAVAVLSARKPSHEQYVGTKEALEKAAAEKAERETQQQAARDAQAAARKSREEAAAINRAHKERLAEFRASRRPPGT